MSAKPGDSFTLQAPPYHRYIVLTSPDENGDVLAVNFTSITPEHPDQGCILRTPDYPSYIKHPTTLRFNKAEMLPAEKIQESAQLKINEPLSATALRKIQEAAIKSPHLKDKFKDLIQGELKS